MPAYRSQLGPWRKVPQQEVHQHRNILLWCVTHFKRRAVTVPNWVLVIAGFNIIIDITILSLPIKTLLSIKRSNRDKYVLFVIFGVGGFSCIARYAEMASVTPRRIPLEHWLISSTLV